ncbi:MAG: hypothetical protein KGI08_08595, partial [Thaumarchaeota archaeon]|nr:hypothetical protein [Nitrososphaerota archaeon]
MTPEMAKTENLKVIAAISISILLVSVLCNPIQYVFADINSVNELNKLKKLNEEHAEEYLKNLGIKSGYGNLNYTTAGQSTKDRNAEMEKAKQA